MTLFLGLLLAANTGISAKQILTAPPVSVGTSNTEGTSNAISRADHVHAGGGGVNLQTSPPAVQQVGGGWVNGIFAVGTLVSGFNTLPTILGRVHILNDTTAGILGSLDVDTYSGGAVAPTNHGINFRTARGTSGIPTAVASGDDLLFLQAFGYQSGGAFSTANRGGFRIQAAEAWTATNQGTKATLQLTPTASTAIQTTPYLWETITSGGVFQRYWIQGTKGSILFQTSDVATDGSGIHLLRNSQSEIARLTFGGNLSAANIVWTLETPNSGTATRMRLYDNTGGVETMTVTRAADGGPYVRASGAIVGDQAQSNSAGTTPKAVGTWQVQGIGTGGGFASGRALIWNNATAPGGVNTEVTYDASPYSFTTNPAASLRFISDNNYSATFKLDLKTSGAEGNALTTRLQISPNSDVTVSLGNLFVKETKGFDTAAAGTFSFGATNMQGLTFHRSGQTATFAGAMAKSGSDAVDFSGGSGAFKTTTGAVTLGSGTVTFSGNAAASGSVNMDFSASTGTTKTTTGILTVGASDVKVSSADLSGQATMVNGTVTVNSAKVTATSRILLTNCAINTSTALGLPTVGVITANTSFVINSEVTGALPGVQALDQSTICWFLVNP